MAKPQPKPDETLYERDFYAWTRDQAAKLRARAHNDIDWDNVAEEIETVGRSDKKEIRSRLEVLLRHLLKWQFQPDKRKSGWHSTISEQRTQLLSLIEDSPSLRDFPGQELEKMYRIARLKADDETGLGLQSLPPKCPYTIGQVLDEEFLPGAPPVRDEHYFD
jgi:hypothetical protein